MVTIEQARQQAEQQRRQLEAQRRQIEQVAPPKLTTAQIRAQTREDVIRRRQASAQLETQKQRALSELQRFETTELKPYETSIALAEQQRTQQTGASRQAYDTALKIYKSGKANLYIKYMGGVKRENIPEIRSLLQRFVKKEKLLRSYAPAALQSIQPLGQIKSPVGYSPAKLQELHSQYYSNLKTQLSDREWNRLSEFDKNVLITSSPSYQAEVQKIYTQPDTTKKMQEFAIMAGYKSPESYGVPYPERESFGTYRPLGFVPSGAVLSETQVPTSIIEKARYRLAMEQGRLDLLESRGQATIGTRAAASFLTIPQSVLGLTSLGLKSPEELSREVYQEGRSMLSPSTYAGIGGASYTDISRLGTGIFFTGVLLKGGSLYSGGRVGSLAALEKAPIRTIGVQVPTKTGMIQKSYGILKTDRNLFFADTTGFGKVAGDYGVARGEGYVYAQKITGKPISQTGYDYFGLTQTGGKAYKVKDYGIIKTKEPTGMGYIGKGGISEKYNLFFKERGTTIKAKGEFYPLGKPYVSTPTQAGAIKKVGTFEAGDIRGSVLGVISGEKVKVTRTAFDKFTRRVDPTRYITKGKDTTILFKVESVAKKDLGVLKPTKIKKTPLSKTFQEQKAAEVFGIQEQTAKEMLFGTAKKVITKQAEEKAAQVSLGTRVSSLWWGKGIYERTEGGLMPPLLRTQQISFIQDREKIIAGLRGKQISLLGLGERDKQIFYLGQPQPSRLGEVQVEKLLSGLKLKQVQKQVLVQPKIDVVPFQPTGEGTKILVPPPPPPPLSEANKKKILKALAKLKGKSVNVSVGMEKGKKKIIYRNLPPKKAYMKAQEFVDRNIQASFRIVPTGKKTKKKDIKTVQMSPKFRPSKRDPLYQVEKKKYRLDMPKEKKQIKKAKKIKWA